MIDLAKIPHALVKPNSFLQRVALFELISPSDYWCACGDHGDSSKESHDFPTFTYQGKAKGNRIVRGRAYSGKPEKWIQEYEYDVYEFSRPAFPRIKWITIQVFEGNRMFGSASIELGEPGFEELKRLYHDLQQRYMKERREERRRQEAAEAAEQEQKRRDLEVQRGKDEQQLLDAFSE